MVDDTEKGFYVVRTVGGQEKNVGSLLAKHAKMRELPIYSVVVFDQLKGYVVVEAEDEIAVRDCMFGVQNVRGIIRGSMDLDKITNLLDAKPIVESLEKGYVIEMISGPFKGERAKVIRVDSNKDEVTVELIEAAVPIPITVKATHVRLVQKTEG